MKNILSLLLLVNCVVFSNNLEANTLPIVKNNGQWNSDIKYKAELPSSKVFFETNRIVFVVIDEFDLEDVHSYKHGWLEADNGITINMHAYSSVFENANDDPSIVGLDQQTPYRNYFLGKNESNWASFVPLFDKVRYNELYDNIAMEYYAVETNMKYDFYVAPGGVAEQILWSYNGLESVSKNGENLVLGNSIALIFELKPYAYQDIDGIRYDVECLYNLEGNTVSFNFPNGYNSDHTLVIDPEVIFGTLSGGTSDNWGTTATNDNDGNLITGGLGFDPVNGATPYPVTLGAFQTVFGGSDNVTLSGGTDMVLTKYTADGTQLIYSTYLGGMSNEFTHSINVTENEDLLIMGTTSSDNFPVTSNAYQSTFGGGDLLEPNNIIDMLNGTDITVTRLSADGSTLIGSTFLGGTGNDGNNSSTPLNFNYSDEARGDILAGSNNEIIVVSNTVSTDFPTTSDALQSTNNGNQDGVICKFNGDLSQLIYSSYFGGDEDDGMYGGKIDSNGNLFVTGGTDSPNLPTNIYSYSSFYNGGQADGYIAKFDANLNFIRCSYLGTELYDQSFFVDFDTDDLVYVMGQTLGDWPLSSDIYGTSGGNQFIVQMNNDLTDVWLSSAFGTAENQINISPTAFLVDECNKIYVSGWGGQTNFGGNNTGSTNSIGSVANMDVTSNAYQSVTDGNDFYFMVLEENLSALNYGTYFGDPVAREHVDGGTSRFDKSGVVYQAVCAGCGGNGFPTTAGAFSEINGSPNCNVGAVKFAFEPELVTANFTSPAVNCDELTIEFTNLSYGGITYEWNFGDDETSQEANPIHTFIAPGDYTVTLVAINNGTCNDSDTFEQVITLSSTPVIELNAEDNDFCFSEESISIEILNPDGVDIQCFITSITNFDEVFAVDFEILSTSESSSIYELNFLLYEDLIGISNIHYIVYEFECITVNEECENIEQFFISVFKEPTIEVSIGECPDDFSGMVEVEVEVTYSPISQSIPTNVFVSGAVDGQEQYDGSPLVLSATLVGNGSTATVTAIVAETGCTTEITFELPVCEECDIDAGTMPTNEFILCHDESVQSQNLGDEIITDGYELSYGLMNTNGEYVAWNSGGMFSPLDLENIAYNTSYTIYAVAGEGLGDGVINIESLCLSISNAQFVTWLSPLDINIQEVCDWTTGNATIVICVTGSYASYDPNSMVTLSGTSLNEISFPANEECVTIDMGQVFGMDFSYSAMDAIGCDVIGDFTSTCDKLAVELVSFEGIQTNDNNKLQWTFGSTSDHSYVALEKSLDAISYATIYNEYGPENTSNLFSSSFIDEENELSAFYRLRIVDIYGVIQYSNNIYLESSNNIGLIEQSVIQISNNEFMIAPETVEVSLVQVFDIKGAHFNVVQDKNHFSLNQLANGLYFVAFRNQNGKQVVPFYVQ